MKLSSKKGFLWKRQLLNPRCAQIQKPAVCAVLSGRGDVAWQHRGLWSLLPGFKSLPRPHLAIFSETVSLLNTLSCLDAGDATLNFFGFPNLGIPPAKSMTTDPTEGARIHKACYTGDCGFTQTWDTAGAGTLPVPERAQHRRAHRSSMKRSVRLHGIQSCPRIEQAVEAVFYPRELDASFMTFRI